MATSQKRIGPNGGSQSGDTLEKRFGIETALTTSGLLLFVLAGLALSVLIVISYARSDVATPTMNFSDNGPILNYYLATYSKQLLLLVTALLSALIGYGLLRAAGTA